MRLSSLVVASVAIGCARQHAPSAPPTVPLASIVPAVSGGTPDFVAVARRVLPSVVSIEAAIDVRRSANHMVPGPRFVSDAPADEVSEGSGFVIDASGLILTNHHVVEGVDAVMVTFTSENHAERTMLAKVVGVAPDYDVALLATERDAHAIPISFADSDALPVGSWVMAVGNPFGLAESVTVGIVSAKGRRDLAPSGRPGLYDFIQTDAAVNPGNSGGPLVDMEGRVVGMNTAINAEGVGLSFSIPSNMLAVIVRELRETGTMRRGWIGLTLQPLTSDLAESFGLEEARGALVCAVDRGSPAQRAGVREGDVVVRYGERAVERSSDLPIWVGTTRPGAHVALQVVRAGRPHDIELEVIEAPGVYELHDEDLGLTLQPVMPDLQDDLQLKSLRGAYVAAVDEGGPAKAAGFKVDDVIVGIGSREIATIEDAMAALKRVKPRSVVRFQIVRESSTLFIAVRR